MRIVFMGTPEFAVVSLQALLSSEHEIVGVFTRADMPKNRGMKLTMPPVKELALQHDIPVCQPASLREDAAFEALQAFAPDIVVVASYGLILPKRVLALPKYGCINVHASLLPKYRGASPINAAILDGCEETGVTIMQMARGLDTGDMLLSRAVPIGVEDTYGTMHDKLAALGGELLLEALEQIENNTVKAVKQDDSLSCYAHMIQKEDTAVSFRLPAKVVSCRIRGYDPAPGAYGLLGGEKLKLFGARLYDDSAAADPGAILRCDKKGLLVQAEGGTVLIREVQISGKKRMPAADCFRGRPQLLSESFR